MKYLYLKYLDQGSKYSKLESVTCSYESVKKNNFNKYIFLQAKMYYEIIRYSCFPRF